MQDNDTYTMAVEYTDTFGGEANYTWVKRATLTLDCGMTKATISRRCKAAMGLTGVSGRVVHNGDRIEFRPYRICAVMFAQVEY